MRGRAFTATLILSPTMGLLAFAVPATKDVIVVDVLFLLLVAAFLTMFIANSTSGLRRIVGQRDQTPKA